MLFLTLYIFSYVCFTFQSDPPLAQACVSTIMLCHLYPCMHYHQHACLTRYPFISIYFAQLGFTVPQIGFLFAIRPWISAVAGEYRCFMTHHS